MYKTQSVQNIIRDGMLRLNKKLKLEDDDNSDYNEDNATSDARENT